MPRPLVFSNGRLLVGLDANLNIREFFYPQVGQFDHLGGQMIRMGLWVDGRFAWLDDEGWTRKLAYRPDCLVSDCRTEHGRLGVELVLSDCVHPSQPVFLRSVKVKNLTHVAQDVRIFFNQDLQIAESHTGMTALYHPFTDSIIHFKGRFAFLFAGRAAGSGLDAYTAAVRRYNGENGSWQDAEDGELGMNPICQGAIDSTLGLRLNLAPGEEAEASYVIACGDSIEDAVERYGVERAKTSTAFLEEAAQHDRGQLAAISHRFEGLPGEIADFCRQGYLILRTQLDREGGILAANDSDIMISNRAHYSYVWPRDGSLVAQVLDRLGDHDAAARYFHFCERLNTGERGAFLQKYQPDGSLGATWHPWITADGPEVPIQEDETALTLLALRDHLKATGSVKSGQSHWEPFALAMAGALLEHRCEATGLPLPSHDLWEERRGLHAFTVATVIVALEAAGELFSAWGLRSDEVQLAAIKMREALLATFWDDSNHRFFRMIGPEGHPDKAPDSSTLLIGLIGALPMADPRVANNLKYIRKWLTVRSDVGGLARYPGDWYWRQSEHYPGNPWIITTMWLAQSLIANAKTRADLREPLEWLRWAKRYAASTGVLSEQLHPDTGAPLSVSPLTWSHSEVLRTALDWCEKRKQVS